jgi:uncharacterized protein (TIRG00374 family)
MFHQFGNLFEIIPAMSRKLLVLLALCVIGAIVAYRASDWDFNTQLFLASLSSLKWGWLTACILLTILTYWIRALRWKILLAPLKSVRLSPLFAITIVGFASIYVLGRAGELARPLWLARREGVPVSGAIATIVVERFLDIILLLGIFGLALVAVEVPSGAEGTLGTIKRGAWSVAAIAGIATIMLFIFQTSSPRIVKLIPFQRIASWVETFGRGLSFLKDRKNLAAVVAQSAILWIAIALQFWFMMLGMNFSFSLGATTLIMVGAAIGSIAQIPVLGGGFQAGMIGMMTLFQVPKEQALATSLIATVLSFGPTIALAGIYMLVQGISVGELKKAIRKPETV